MRQAQALRRPTAKELRVKPQAIVDAIGACAWRIIHLYLPPRCCIEATRIGISVLKHFGIAGEPVCTLALAGCPSFASWRSAGFPEPPPKDAFFVVTDEKDNGEGYPGHLVISGRTSKNGKFFLLDLAAPQMNRPVKKIMVPEAVVGYFPGPIWRDEEELHFSGEEGTVLTYKRHDKPAVDWRKTGGWDLPRRRFEIFHAVTTNLIDATLRELGK